MRLAKCEKGHYYDKDKFTSCPHCAGEQIMPGETVAFSDEESAKGEEQKDTPVVPKVEVEDRVPFSTKNESEEKEIEVVEETKSESTEAMDEMKTIMLEPDDSIAPLMEEEKEPEVDKALLERERLSAEEQAEEAERKKQEEEMKAEQEEKEAKEREALLAKEQEERKLQEEEEEKQREAQQAEQALKEAEEARKAEMEREELLAKEQAERERQEEEARMAAIAAKEAEEEAIKKAEEARIEEEKKLEEAEKAAEAERLARAELLEAERIAQAQKRAAEEAKKMEEKEQAEESNDEFEVSKETFDSLEEIAVSGQSEEEIEEEINEEMDEELTTEEIEEEKDRNHNMVVGWLIGMDGVNKGQSYTVRMGRNFIGRSKNSDMCILDNPKITYEKHAIMTYDVRTDKLFIQPGETRELMYLNEELMLNAALVKHEDIIEMADEKFLYVEFRSDKLDLKKEVE